MNHNKYMQNEIIIKCSKCKNALVIKDVQGVDSIKQKCPYCNLEFDVKIRRRPITIGPVSNNESLSPGNRQEIISNDERTVFQKLESVSGMPVLMTNGRKYKLHEGRNIVGRSCVSSTANIQLLCDDQYMSRQNAIIDVTKTSFGEWYVKVRSCNERNLVKINEQVLAIDDVSILQPGNVLRLGHTHVLYTIE